MIDVVESVREELPAVLVQRIAQYYTGITEVKVKANRGGWRLLKDRLKLVAPTDMQIDEIALRTVNMVLKDIENNGPAQNYHALLAVQIGETGQTQDKYVPLKAIIDGDGDLAVYDDEDPGAHRGGGGDMRDDLEGFTDLAIRSLGAVVEATEGYGGLAKGLKDVLQAVTSNMQTMAQQSSADVEMQLRIHEMNLRSEDLLYRHKERMSKYSHAGDFLITLAGPIGEQLSDFLENKLDLESLGMNTTGEAEGQDGSGPGNPSRLARQFDRFLSGLDQEQFAAFKGFFTDEEWDCIHSSRAVTEDVAFAELFRKLADLFRKREVTEKQFQNHVVSAVGVRHAMKLMKIWKELGKMGV